MTGNQKGEIMQIREKNTIAKGVRTKWIAVLQPYKSQEQITQSLLCISTTGHKDLERGDTKL